MNSAKIVITFLLICSLGYVSYSAPASSGAGEPDLYDSPNVVILNESDFDEIVKDGKEMNWFVMFYAPWCPHCKKLIPTWDSLAQNFTNKVRFGRVDCEKNGNLRDRFSIMGYPTLVYISNGKSYEYKDKPRTPENLTAFAQEGYLTENGEPLSREPDRIKNFWKSATRTYERLYQVALLYPYHAVGAGIFLLLIIIGLFWMIDNIMKGISDTNKSMKNEAKGDTNNSANKKNKTKRE